ncbi:hypothetical protein D3C85_1195800 [compost metagenome]
MGHRRHLGEVRRAGADAQMAYTRQLQREVDGAQVDHFQLCIQLPRQHADGGATADEVMQHLPGHCLRVGRDTLGDHAVIAGKDCDPDLLNAGLELALQAGQLHRQLLQAAQRASRFGQLLLTRQGLFANSLVNRTTGFKPPGLTHSAGPLRVSGRPATVSTTR